MGNVSQNRVSIMVVEDNPEIREVIVQTLNDNLDIGTKDSLFIVEAANGFEALYKLRNMKFDLVITDLNMPSKDGKGLIKSMLEQNMLRKNQIIVLSGEIQKEDVILLKYYGVTNIIAKPFDQVSFIERVSNLLDLKKNVIRAA